MFYLKTIPFLFIILFSKKVLSQEKKFPRIAFSFSARKWPINIKPYQPDNLGQSWGNNIIDSKPRIGIDFKQKISVKYPIELQFSNYIFYAPIERFDDFFGGVSYSQFKRDHFVDLFYSFKSKKKKWYFDAGFGFGLINCGSKFSYTKKYYDLNNNFIEEKIITKHSRFFAPRLNFGLHKNKYSAYANIIKTPNYSFKSHPSLAIEFKGTYTINPFIKKAKSLEYKKVKLFAETQGMGPTVAIGIAARPTQMSLTDYNKKPLRPFALVSSYDHNFLIDQKARLGLDIKQRLSKRFPIVLQLSNYFGFNAPYDHYNFNFKRTLKRDHFIDLLLAMQGKKQRLNFILGTGIGVFNCGTKHTYFKSIYNNSLSIYETKFFEKNWRFVSPRITLGIQKNDFAAFINLNLTPDLSYDNKAIAFEFKTSYTISNFKKVK